MGTGRRKNTEKLGDVLMSQAIGNRPIKPRSYDLRKKLNTPEDQKFCAEWDKKINDWEEKANKIKQQQLEERKKRNQDCDNYEIQPNPAIEITVSKLYSDFLKAYRVNEKILFSTENIYSKTKEPLEFVYTLIYYFLRHDNFFKSPLLRKDLSNPSFDKGLIVIGGYGCSKTSTFNALAKVFRSYVSEIEEKRPSNQNKLLSMFRLVSCVADNEVIKYNSSNNPSEVVNSLLTLYPLYIDDITRENEASKFGKCNIFKIVLTQRCDQRKRNYMTINYLEDEHGNTLSTEESLSVFRTKYDGRVHDRLFGSCNIIELKGKSMRR